MGTLGTVYLQLILGYVVELMYGNHTVTVKYWLDEPLMLTRWVQPCEVAAAAEQLKTTTFELEPKHGAGYHVVGGSVLTAHPDSFPR